MSVTASQQRTFDDHFAGRHDSLMQMLLRVSGIQPFIVQLLLEKVRTPWLDIFHPSHAMLQLPEFIGDDDATMDGGEGNRPDETPANETPRLLLSQLRWLDFVEDSTALTSKLLECLQVRTRSYFTLCIVQTNADVV